MRKIICAVLTLLIVGAAEAKQKEKVPVLTLHKRNTLVVRNVIMHQSVAATQEEANKLSQNLSKDESIYLFLDTPGGSVDAGEQLIASLKGLPQSVHTVTNFAASMGFVAAQSLGNRYILPNGILMSHRAYGGAEGQIPGELNTRVNFWTHILDKKDAEIAKRIGMSKKEYQKLIVNEHWVHGSDAVATKMSDKVILVRCDKELSEGRTEENVYTFFGPVRVTYSTCPLVAAPLEVDFSELALNEYDSEDKIALAKTRKVVLQLLYNKKSFYYDYIVTNKYKNVLP